MRNQPVENARICRKRTGTGVSSRLLRMECLERRELLATITVTSLTDNMTTDGLVTLREAILAASTNQSVPGAPSNPPTAGSSTDPDEIIFSTTLGTDPIITLNLALGELQVNNVGTQPANADLTINARSQRSLTIDGHDPSSSVYGDGIRIFHMFDPPNAVGTTPPPPLVTLKGLTLTKGDAWETSFADSFGGAILSDSRLLIENSSITSSQAGHGGAIYVRVSGTDSSTREVLRIENSLISGNTAGKVDLSSTGSGGGIYVTSGYLLAPTLDKVVIRNGSSIADNVAHSGDYDSRNQGGGGVFAQLYGADFTMEDTTISGNQAGFGGGVHHGQRALLGNMGKTGRLAPFASRR